MIGKSRQQKNVINISLDECISYEGFRHFIRKLSRRRNAVDAQTLQDLIHIHHRQQCKY